MQSHPREEVITVKEETNDFTSSSFGYHLDSTPQEPIEVSPSSSSSSSSTSLLSEDRQNDDDQLTANADNQLVLYDPHANGCVELQPVTEPCPLSWQPLSRTRQSAASRALPSVGAFTVQCANCFKWRLIPTKEKYEEIREHIIERPFVCETGREWRPELSCDDPADISQDGSRLWAIDKPNIAQPPPGWQRLLRIRAEGSTRFADVYYQAPSGKKLRSMVEIQKYLMEHPEYVTDGVTLSRFSFQIPKPLQENYVRKRPRVTASHDNSKPLEPGEVNPAWASTENATNHLELALGRPALPPPYFDARVFDPLQQPPRKQARKESSKHV